MDDKLLKALATHFECLGYDVQPPQPDGWMLAVHPVRYNVSFRPFDLGIRLHCGIILGKRLPNLEDWHAFLNVANEQASVARFSIAPDADGDWLVRVRALLPAKYDRRTFGLVLDAWHEDLSLLRGAPRPSSDEEDDAEEDDDEKKPAAVVN